MKGNDLDNVVVPRDILVWEGLLGVFPDEKAGRRFAKAMSRKRWVAAVSCFVVNETLAKQIWHLTWNYGVEIDLITYQGPEFREALEDRIDREGLPIRHVLFDHPHIFARSLAYMPDVRSVYDPYEEHQFLYGGKGRYLSPDQATLFGVL